VYFYLKSHYVNMQSSNIFIIRGADIRTYVGITGIWIWKLIIILILFKTFPYIYLIYKQQAHWSALIIVKRENNNLFWYFFLFRVRTKRKILWILIVVKIVVPIVSIIIFQNRTLSKYQCALLAETELPWLHPVYYTGLIYITIIYFPSPRETASAF